MSKPFHKSSPTLSRALRAGSGLFSFAVVCALLVAPIACTKNSAQQTPIDPVARGKQVYQSNCIACHNVDPHKPGAIGPDVWGSSQELIEARVLHGSYPAGYKPKRESRTMAALPYLKDEIPALAAFLNAK